jgi:hypothetical protein
VEVIAVGLKSFKSFQPNNLELIRPLADKTFKPSVLIDSLPSSQITRLEIAEIKHVVCHSSLEY